MKLSNPTYKRSSETEKTKILQPNNNNKWFLGFGILFLNIAMFLLILMNSTVYPEMSDPNEIKTIEKNIEILRENKEISPLVLTNPGILPEGTVIKVVDTIKNDTFIVILHDYLSYNDSHHCRKYIPHLCKVKKTKNRILRSIGTTSEKTFFKKYKHCKIEILEIPDKENFISLQKAKIRETEELFCFIENISND